MARPNDIDELIFVVVTKYLVRFPVYVGACTLYGYNVV